MSGAFGSGGGNSISDQEEYANLLEQRKLLEVQADRERETVKNISEEEYDMHCRECGRFTGGNAQCPETHACEQLAIVDGRLALLRSRLQQRQQQQQQQLKGSPNLIDDDETQEPQQDDDELLPEQVVQEREEEEDLPATMDVRDENSQQPQQQQSNRKRFLVSRQTLETAHDDIGVAVDLLNRLYSFNLLRLDGDTRTALIDNIKRLTKAQSALSVVYKDV